MGCLSKSLDIRHFGIAVDGNCHRGHIFYSSPASFIDGCGCIAMFCNPLQTLKLQDLIDVWSIAGLPSRHPSNNRVERAWMEGINHEGRLLAEIAVLERIRHIASAVLVGQQLAAVHNIEGMADGITLYFAGGRPSEARDF